MKSTREKLMEPLEHLLELGGTKKDITLLVLSGLAVVCSLAGIQPFPFVTLPGWPSCCAACPSFWKPSSAW